MKLPNFTPFEAILWGGLAAAVLDIGAVFAYWATQGGTPAGILQTIATSVMGPAAYEIGFGGTLLGLFLHVFVSYVFAAAYVAAASRAPILITRPILCGLAYGAIAKVVMGEVVVPLSRATFGGGDPPLLQTMISWFIHLALFGLPIALAAGRIRREAAEREAPHQSD